MPIEGVSAQFAIGDNIDASSLLQRDSLVHRSIFDGLESGGTEGTGLELGASVYQIGWPEQASYHFTVISHAKYLLLRLIRSFRHFITNLRCLRLRQSQFQRAVS